MSTRTNIKIPEYDKKSLYPNKKRLSSSQVIDYETNPKKFYIDWVLGARKPSSKSMLIGLIFSELHRNREYDARSALRIAKAPKRIADLFEKVIKTFPDVPAEVPLECEFMGWKFRATLDGFHEPSYTIIENKTGQLDWTQERVNFSNQITFQAWVHWKKYGVPPRQIILNWVNTNYRAKSPINTFKTSRKVRALQQFEKRIELVVEGIEIKNWTKRLY